MGQGPAVQGVKNAAGTHKLFRLRMGSYVAKAPGMAQPASFQLVMPRFLRAR
jgi:hypothetical protein